MDRMSLASDEALPDSRTEGEDWQGGLVIVFSVCRRCRLLGEELPEAVMDLENEAGQEAKEGRGLQGQHQQAGRLQWHLHASSKQVRERLGGRCCCYNALC